MKHPIIVESYNSDNKKLRIKQTKAKRAPASSDEGKLSRVKELDLIKRFKLDEMQSHYYLKVDPVEYLDKIIARIDKLLKNLNLDGIEITADRKKTKICLMVNDFLDSQKAALIKALKGNSASDATFAYDKNKQVFYCTTEYIQQDAVRRRKYLCALKTIKAKLNCEVKFYMKNSRIEISMDDYISYSSVHPLLPSIRKEDLDKLPDNNVANNNRQKTQKNTASIKKDIFVQFLENANTYTYQPEDPAALSGEKNKLKNRIKGLNIEFDDKDLKVSDGKIIITKPLFCEWKRQHLLRDIRKSKAAMKAEFLFDKNNNVYYLAASDGLPSFKRIVKRNELNRLANKLAFLYA